jgi:hypothetical protein
MFLSQTELADLTGRKRASSQIRWLAQAGIRHVLAADGRPRVLRQEVERAMLGGQTAKREPHLRVAGL